MLLRNKKGTLKESKLSMQNKQSNHMPSTLLDGITPSISNNQSLEYHQFVLSSAT